MNPEEKKQLLSVFKNVLACDHPQHHNDLVEIYATAIPHIKNFFPNKTKEEKAGAIYYLRLNYLSWGLKLDSIVNLIVDFFSLCDNEFEKYKNDFVLITDEEHLFLSFIKMTVNPIQ